jgi:aminomethyltransferase
MMRSSMLDVRHRELGATFAGDHWNNMALPWSYLQDLQDEVIATRTRATLIDVTSVNLVNVTGPDAEAVLNKLVTIDLTKLKPGFGRIAGEVNDHGALCDDILVIREGQDKFRLSHGSGATKSQLAQCAEGKNVKWEADQDTHCMTLQGPISANVLNPHCSRDLTKLAYFEFIECRLFDKNVVISRSGYAGEYGFEVYCASNDALYLWDNILAVGRPLGVLPASWNCLEITRLECCLLFFPFDMPEGDTTPWEVKMSWAVDLDKQADYIGKQAVLASKGKERVLPAGLSCRTTVPVEVGAAIHVGDKEVGVVTSAGYSKYLMQSLAMVHVKPEAARLGTEVEVRGPNVTCRATVVPTPFYDPMRLRTHPERAAK